MSDVDKLQNAEEAVAQMQEEARRRERERVQEELSEQPVKETAQLPRRYEEIPYSHIVGGINLRTGPLPDVQEMALSIKEQGLLYPVLVRPLSADNGVLTYELVDGARRLAGWALLYTDDPEKPIPAIVVEGAAEATRYELMFTAMAQFRDWEPVAKARALRYLLDLNPEQTASTLARSLGLRPDYVQRHLRLLDLPQELKSRLEKGDLSFTVADLLRRGIAAGRLNESQAGEIADNYAAGDLTADEVREMTAPPRKETDPLAEGDDSDAPWGSKVYDPEVEQETERLQRVADEALEEEKRQAELEADADRLLSLGGKPAGAADVTPYEGEEGGSGQGRSGPEKKKLYSYMLGRLLRDSAPAGYLDELGIKANETYAYAWKLDSAARLEALFDLTQAMAEDDMALPTEIFPNGV